MKHRTGTVELTGDELVIRIAGTRNVEGREEPWTREFRVPLEEASIERGSWGQLTVYRGEEAVQLLEGCGRRDVSAFENQLADAQDAIRRRGPLGAVAACARCGAPGQAQGRPCAYCAVTVGA